MSTANQLGALQSHVTENKGVISVQMIEVRDKYGAQRLGKTVRGNISNALKGHGIGHFPEELPDGQDKWVILYTLGSQVDKLIQAILNPGETSGEEIRSALAQESEDALRRIREIVCS